MSDREYKEYKEWSSSVNERDNYTCQHCGSKKIYNINRYIFKLNNLDYNIKYFYGGK